MTERLRYILTADASNLIHGFDSGAASVEGFEQSLAGVFAKRGLLEQSGIPVRQAEGNLGRFASANAQAEGAVRSLGFVMNDALQFQHGFAQGSVAIANNLGPLTEQIALATRTAGGLTAGLRVLGSAFLGPLGLVFAINAAISGWIAYSNRTKEATEETKDLPGCARQHNL